MKYIDPKTEITKPYGKIDVPIAKRSFDINSAIIKNKLMYDFIVELIPILEQHNEYYLYGKALLTLSKNEEDKLC